MLMPKALYSVPVSPFFRPECEKIEDKVRQAPGRMTNVPLGVSRNVETD